jgi:predicted metalloprotease with PDZ domain
MNISILALIGAVSAPVTNVHYDVTIDSQSVAHRQIEVAMHFRVAGPGPVLLSLPAWSPGHYTVLWFARRVSHFNPTVDGQPLDWRKLDYQTWRITAKPGQLVTVSFSYLADTIDRAVAWTKPDFAFFNGTNVFLYPTGRPFDWPATVSVHVPATWRVATGMQATPTGPNTFVASTYHELVDHPVFVGHFDIDSTALANGHWMRFVSYPASQAFPARAKRTLGWLASEARAESAVFDTIPWKTYTVLQIADSAANGGGLEHEDSQLDEIGTSQLDADFLPWLYSHELFHSWNVKRLRPADLFPYRYAAAQPTGWLWVSEGITDYYSDLATMRAGIDDSTRFLSTQAMKIRQSSGPPPTALTDASLSVWIDPTDGSAYLYYPKGSVAGLLLDICIRDASRNTASLDRVMRALYAATYEQHRGFTAADWWGAVSHAAGGRSFATFNARYIEGRTPFPYDSVFALAGLRLTLDSARVVQFGVDGSPDSLGFRIDFATPTAPLKVGDHLVSVGDVAIHADSSFAAVNARYGASSDSTVPMIVRRGDATDTVTIPLHRVMRPTANLTVDPNASTKAAAIRHSLFTGTPSPHV